MKFYVYEWFIKNTNEIFYVGKGCKNRYKEIKRRNKIFKIFYENFDCDVKIIKYFDNEDEAFCFEHERIMELKQNNQAKANLDYGDKGGCNFAWTEEMKNYQSIYNPMKAYEQRERMSKNNPMKNKETVKKVVKKLSKPVIINGIYYNSVKEASIKTSHTEGTISRWCKQGYDTNGKSCYYANETPKEIPNIKKTHPKATTPKSVIIDEIYFDTVKDGAEYIGVWPETLIRAIKQNRKCKGHNCKYANQQPSISLND